MTHQALEDPAQSSSGPKTWLDLLDDDYEHAVLRLVSDLHRKTNAQTLVCATVELLPKEIPPPASQPPRSITLSKNHFLYTHDVTISARRGLEWYRDSARGLALRPGKDGTLGSTKDADAIILQAQPLNEEPTWPNLVTSTLRMPFHGDAFYSSRVHHLIPASFEIWDDGERDRARDWLDQTMHFDFDVFPEYWGSVHLCVPNPVFRSLHAQSSADGTELVVALQARRGKSLDGLQVMVEEERPTGVTVHVMVAASPILRFPVHGRQEQVRERVIDPHRGVLYQGGFAMPGVAMSLTARLGGGTRRVRVPAAGDSTAEEYDIPVLSDFTSGFTEPSRPGREGAQHLWGAQRRRQRRSRGEAEQRWFRDQVADGIAELRKLIGNASREIWIYDPYFGPRELLRAALASSEAHVGIHVLTGAACLRLPAKEGESLGTLLWRYLRDASRAPHMNKINVKVMPGASPPLHDRFLRVDDALWLMGSSINSFGARGTMLLKVPDPEPILADLTVIWNSADDLEAWVNRRHKNRHE